jgi:hypothetical protein
MVMAKIKFMLKADWLNLAELLELRDLINRLISRRTEECIR